MPTFVIVSGIPGSGKSTLARKLAEKLTLPYLDKDSFLESLFRNDQAPSLERRAVLSRKADALFQTEALNSREAVLSSWWRHPSSNGTSGTPTEWLQDRSINLVEVYCHCPASTAVQRFLARQRHPGHADKLRDPSALLDQFEEAASLGSLFPAHSICQCTHGPSTDEVAQQLSQRVRQFISQRSAA
jgi:hypothetical protein